MLTSKVKEARAWGRGRAGESRQRGKDHASTEAARLGRRPRDRQKTDEKKKGGKAFQIPL